MSGSFFLLPALLAFLFSLFVVRAGAIALMMTGVEKDKARFQALSAFSGTGFTTREAESVMNDPKRRRIITWLIIVGNIGIIAVIVTATSSLVQSEGYHVPVNALALAGGGYVLYWIATRKGLVRRFDSFIEGRLVKSRALEEGTTEDLLHFLEGYGLLRGIVSDDSSLSGSTLAGLRLSELGVLVLGIERGPRWIPIPPANESIRSGDRLIVYGPLATIRNVFDRL